MPTRDRTVPKDPLQRLEAIQEYIIKQKLPRATSEEIEKLMAKSGDARQTISDLLTGVFDPSTGTIDETMLPPNDPRLKGFPPGSKRRHVTEFNPDELKQLLKDTISDGVRTEKDLHNLKAALDARLELVKEELTVSGSDNNGSLGNPALRQAIRKIFGQNTTTITYDMYKQALALRERFQQEDMTDAMSDNPFAGGKNIVSVGRERATK